MQSLLGMLRNQWPFLPNKEIIIFFFGGIKRQNNMKDVNLKITMGNDEFILYIRKRNSACDKDNDFLGRMIWIWIRNKDNDAVKVVEDQSCLWAIDGNLDFISSKRLPKTATQIKFNSILLSELYEYLNHLADS